MIYFLIKKEPLITYIYYKKRRQSKYDFYIKKLADLFSSKKEKEICDRAVRADGFATTTIFKELNFFYYVLDQREQRFIREQGMPSSGVYDGYSFMLEREMIVELNNNFHKKHLKRDFI